MKSILRWPQEIFRIIKIQRIMMKYDLYTIMLVGHPFPILQWVAKVFPWNWFGYVDLPVGVRVRRALEELGPVFVKLGQLLSTRHDFLHEDITKELALLQDKVPPFSHAMAINIIETSFGKKLNQLFATFENEPLASASIAQVHSASLHNGEKIIVKVVRPDILQPIKRDIALLKRFASTAERYSAHIRQLRLKNVVIEFERTIYNELDMQKEAANASLMRRNCKDAAHHIPAIIWPMTCEKVLVMEKLSGIPLSNPDALNQSGCDGNVVATALINLLFTQVFEDGFFHADLHPGNIFLLKKQSKKKHSGILAVVDFGIVSNLSNVDQNYLAQNFLAFLNRDYPRIAKLHIESGWVPVDTRIDELQTAIRMFCEPILDRPLSEVSMSNILLGLLKTALNFKMEILPQLLLLQKTLVNVEGIVRHLAPGLNIWEVARPTFTKISHQKKSFSHFSQSIREEFPTWITQLPEAPTHFLSLAESLRKGKLKVQLEEKVLKDIQLELRTGFSMLSKTILLIGILIILLNVILN